MASFEDVLVFIEKKFEDKKFELHARLINTFSLLEYIGSRKIIKSQVDRSIQLETLGHIAEELRHAQILKRLALKLSQNRLTTYADDHLIAGSSARHYIQAIDHGVEKLLSKKDEWLNYLLTTLLIEERAAQVYPAYEAYLNQQGIAGKLSSIIRDEDQHLQFVVQQLKKQFSDAEELLEHLRDLESECFSEFMKAIIATGDQTRTLNLPH